MGWFDGLFGQGGSSSSSSDPLANLDPKVREFLQKESPMKYKPGDDAAAGAGAKSSQAQTQPQPPISQAHQPSTAQQATTDPTGPAVPAESLFQDGRYADLWKTYKPLAAIEAETKSDHERLMDVLDAYKDRRAQIGRAALESCALEQLDWNECIKSGPLSKRMTMCHAEMKKFERCYNMQSRLLKALGYLSTYDRDRAVDEAIQIHADALYHRMLDQEAAIEQAKAEGRPVPEPDLSAPVLLPPTQNQNLPTAAVAIAAATTAASFPSSSSTPPPPPPPQLPPVPDDLRKQWDEKLAKLPAGERPAEEAAMRAELQAQTELHDRVRALRAAQAAEREKRKAEGKATLTDRVSGWFGQ